MTLTDQNLREKDFHDKLQSKSKGRFENIFYKGIKNDHCHINIGSGEEVSISELVKILTDISRFEGRIVFDESMPDGTKRKLLNLEAIHGLGWKSKIPLESGIRKTYEWYQKQSFSKQENLN